MYVICSSTERGDTYSLYDWGSGYTALLTSLAGHFTNNLFDSVLPFWMAHSIDSRHGGFFTCLDRDGTLYDHRKYLWLNGRQLWTLSKLYNEAPGHPDRERWLAAARGAAAFLRAHARDPQGRCYFALMPDGQPAAFQRKPYSAVFLAIGYHEYWKATGEPWALDEARDLFRRLREWIANPALLGRPAFPALPAFSQLADLMVQASVALELSTTDPDPLYRDLLQYCLNTILTTHFHAPRKLLLENADPSGATHYHLPEARLFCPGHIAEVSWFLFEILDRLPDAAREAQVLDLLESALEQGWDHEHGGLFYFLDLENKPVFHLEANMKLWWPHTEALQSLVYAVVRSGESRFQRWLDRVFEYTWHTFPDPRFGEWFGYCDRSGKPTHSLKGNNYKGCFHVPRSLWLSIRKIEAAG